MISAPWCRPTAMIASSSVETYTRSTSRLARAASSGYAMSGRPNTGCRFLPGKPVLPPRPSSNAATVIGTRPSEAPFQIPFVAQLDEKFPTTLLHLAHVFRRKVVPPVAHHAFPDGRPAIAEIRLQVEPGAHGQPVHDAIDLRSGKSKPIEPRDARKRRAGVGTECFESDFMEAVGALRHDRLPSSDPGNRLSQRDVDRVGDPHVFRNVVVVLVMPMTGVVEHRKVAGHALISQVPVDDDRAHPVLVEQRQVGRGGLRVEFQDAVAAR